MLSLVLSSDSHVFEPPDLWVVEQSRLARGRAHASTEGKCWPSGGGSIAPPKSPLPSCVRRLSTQSRSST